MTADRLVCRILDFIPQQMLLRRTVSPLQPSLVPRVSLRALGTLRICLGC